MRLRRLNLQRNHDRERERDVWVEERASYIWNYIIILYIFAVACLVQSVFVWNEHFNECKNKTMIFS